MHLDRIAARFDAMEARLCRVQKRFDRMNANLERAGSRLERIQVRLDRRHSPFAVDRRPILTHRKLAPAPSLPALRFAARL